MRRSRPVLQSQICFITGIFTNEFRPFIFSFLIGRAPECLPRTCVGKNLKTTVSKTHFIPFSKCETPNDEKQLGFTSPILVEQGQRILIANSNGKIQQLDQ